MIGGEQDFGMKNVISFISFICQLLKLFMKSSLENMLSLVNLSKLICMIYYRCRFMSLEELNNLFICGNLCDETFGQREIGI